jgi:hypothetical protein
MVLSELHPEFVLLLSRERPSAVDAIPQLNSPGFLMREEFLNKSGTICDLKLPLYK